MVDIGISRSRSNRMVMGVCGGIAAHFGVSAKMVRLATLLIAIIVPGVSLIAVIITYIALAVLLPEDEGLRA